MQKSARAKLFIVAEKDSFAPLAATKATYEKAKEPKAMKTFPVLHFEMYEEPWTSKAAAARALDDLALWTDVKEVGPFVVTGCAHSGPINTLMQVKRLGSFDHICGLIGGTHMLWRSDDYVQKTIKELKKFNFAVISPCHCTGWKATTWFWQAFPKEFILNYCYRVIEAGKRTEQQVW